MGNDKWLEDFGKTGLFNLTRRHLTLIWLLYKYEKQERLRIAKITYAEAMWFVKIPTISTFFSKRSNGEIVSDFNYFIEANGSYDALIGEANQLSRVVVDLQKMGILFNPRNPLYAEAMGTKQALVLTKSGRGIAERIESRAAVAAGTFIRPHSWPDSLPYDPIAGVALWDYATYPSKPGVNND